MTVSFDQGDGSFEVHLEKHEPLPQEWNIPGVYVLRDFQVIKQPSQVL